MKHPIINLATPRAVRRVPDAAAQSGSGWYTIRADAGQRTAAIDLYGPVGGWLGVGADEFRDQLTALDVDQIDLHVNSPGGSVFDGTAIYNTLVQHPANVTVHIDGLAASIASVIAMAGDEIRMSAAAQFMIHDAAGLCLGNAADMGEMRDILDKASGIIARVYAARAGGDAQDWRTAMLAETWYTAEEAAQAGLVDEVVPLKTGASTDDGTEGEGQEPAARWLDLVAQFRGTPVDGAVATHHTSTVDIAWSKSEQETKLPSPMPLAKAKAMYAWYDASQVDADKIVKAGCKFPHHQVSADGTPGAANLPACRNGLARLDSADIPAGDRDGVRRHLQAHLDDAKGADDHGITFDAHAFRRAITEGIPG